MLLVGVAISARAAPQSQAPKAMKMPSVDMRMRAPISIGVTSWLSMVFSTITTTTGAKAMAGCSKLIRPTPSVTKTVTAMPTNGMKLSNPAASPHSAAFGTPITWNAPATQSLSPMLITVIASK